MMREESRKEIKLHCHSGLYDRNNDHFIFPIKALKDEIDKSDRMRKCVISVDEFISSKANMREES